MSSYLNFYLVPKKTRKMYDYNKDDGHTEIEVDLATGEPLLFMSYSRSNDIYQAYNETLNPVFIGMKEPQYSELTYENAKQVVNEYEEDLNKTEERLKIDYKMLKEGGYSSELWEDIHSMEEYLKQQQKCVEELKYISSIVYEVTEGYTDFEKVLINID